MDQPPIYPLRFDPTCQYRLLGGRRVGNLLPIPLPSDGLIGEGLLSDRADHPSHVDDGSLKGRTLGQLLTQWPEQLLGKLARRFRQFPLPLKFLDACETFSLQVHPPDQQKNHLPVRETSKTEAWVVLEAGFKSCIYAGLKPATATDTLWQAILSGNVTDHLAFLVPKPGGGNCITDGTVHSLGDVALFEVQENNNVMLLLVDVGAYLCRPYGSVSLREIAFPEGP